MMKKILIAAAAGAAMLGAVAPSYADYYAADGTYVRTYPRRVIVERPAPYYRTYYYGNPHYRHYRHHRVWHHGRWYYDRY